MDGHSRERQVRKRLEAEGWWVARAAGSLGDADLVALRYGFTLEPVDELPLPLAEALLIEVKANKAGGPFANFRPKDRAKLLAAADKAGATAILAYWPAHKPLRFIHSEDWPNQPHPTEEETDE
jgi:Holliday junction resolvase